MMHLEVLWKIVCHFWMFVKKLGYNQTGKQLKERVKNRCVELNIDYEIINNLTEKESKTCLQCGIEKSYDEFYNKRNVCKECVRAFERQKYAKKMNIINEFKSQFACAHCGDNRYYVLDFHHIDPSKKDYSISHNSHAKIETVMKEVKKCIALCSNCHREFHFLNKEYGTTLNEYLCS